MIARILRSLCLRRDNPGRALAKIGHDKRRAKIHAVADEMRRNAGLPPVEWPN